MKPSSTLFINQLAVSVFLGWPENERLKKQTITLDFKIVFSEPPKACETDKLEDTLCYSHLIHEIRTFLAEKHFHLIEHLGAELYHTLKSHLPDTARMQIYVTKHPHIQDFTGHVQFCFGDA